MRSARSRGRWRRIRGMGYVLPNGMLCIAWRGRAGVCAGHAGCRVVVYAGFEEQGAGTVQRLPDGLTTWAERGAVPRIVEADAKGVVQHETPLAGDRRWPHADAQGTQAAERQLPGASPARLQGEGVLAGGRGADNIPPTSKSSEGARRTTGPSRPSGWREREHAGQPHARQQDGGV